MSIYPENPNRHDSWDDPSEHKSSSIPASDSALSLLLRSEADEWAKIEQSLGPDQADRSTAFLLRAAATEIERLNKRFQWARENCRVIYYPPNNAYPIEHALHAGKDMWEALTVAADTSSPNARHEPRDQ